MSYWVAHMKTNGTVSESVLDFNKRAKILNHNEYEFKFQTSCRDGSAIAVIPKENILFAECIEEVEE